MTTKPTFAKLTRPAAVMLILPFLACTGFTFSEEPHLPVCTIHIDKTHLLSVEIAATPVTRTKGLMFRKHLEPNRGMLFVFPRLDFWPFWMKNTRIPLDMIWLDETKQIVAIFPDVQACKKDPCPSYDPMIKSLYVLEIPAGRARSLKLKNGDILHFELPAKVIHWIDKEKTQQLTHP